MLHSGHVAFFRAASRYGDLYVGIGSDSTVEQLKKRKTVYSEQERLYMVKSIRYVTDAYINRGSGMMDFVDTVERVKPDFFVVNTDGGSDEKRRFCEERGIRYVELQRIPDAGMEARSTTALRSQIAGGLPYSLDLAGGWIDRPCVSSLRSGWALTVSLEPIERYEERSGMATATREVARKLWPYELPDTDGETLARMLFCVENNPDRRLECLSGAHDSIGICMPGLTRQRYAGHYWPVEIESCRESDVLSWLEKHICLVPTFPRSEQYEPFDCSKVTTTEVALLSEASIRCWDAIMNRNVRDFAVAVSDSFETQVNMWPSMLPEKLQPFIDHYALQSLAYKLCGNGGGGYIALIIDGRLPQGAHPIKIRR